MLFNKRKEKIFEIIEKAEVEKKLENKIALISRASKFYDEKIDVDKINYNKVMKDIIDKTKYRVAIFGENKLYLKVINEIINNEKIKITGIYDFVDCEKESVYGKIIPIKELQESEVDYIINLKNNNSSEKIINFMNYLSFFHDYEFCNGFYNFEENKTKLKGIMVGTSSHEMAVLTEKLNSYIANLAVSLQDIFYGKKMIEYALLQDKENRIEWCVIGLFHQSFVYDLSSHVMPSFSYRSNMYYRVTKDLHNFKGKLEMENEYARFSDIAKKILKEDYDRILYEEMKEKNETGINYLRNKIYDRNILSEKEKEDEERGIKNYLELNNQETVKENLELIRELLIKLKEKEIKPIILICPMAEIWRELSAENSNTREIFDWCIKELKKEFEFELYDYFDREEFVDEDFYNASHLNFKGAEKFTKMFAADSGIGMKE